MSAPEQLIYKWANRKDVPAEIRAAMVARGYALFGTGGGCEAFISYFGDGDEAPHRLVTLSDDPSVPTAWCDPICVGVYDHEAEDVDGVPAVFFGSVREFLAAHDAGTLPAPEAN